MAPGPPPEVYTLANLAYGEYDACATDVCNKNCRKQHAYSWKYYLSAANIIIYKTILRMKSISWVVSCCKSHLETICNLSLETFKLRSSVKKKKKREHFACRFIFVTLFLHAARARASGWLGWGWDDRARSSEKKMVSWFDVLSLHDQVLLLKTCGFVSLWNTTVWIFAHSRFLKKERKLPHTNL